MATKVVSQRISDAIRDGAEVFFRTQYGCISKMAMLLTVVILCIYLFGTTTPHMESSGLGRSSSAYITIAAFILGAFWCCTRGSWCLLLKKEQRKIETLMASSSSSSGSVPNAPRKYDVFISFRGETRKNFTSHLHAALSRASLKVFRDDKKLETGDEIAPSLIQAIKDSSVSVIVFSKDYASSKWCLDELLQIMQYREDEGQYVIPIFYKVDPTDVRNQTGAYKKAFVKHEIDYHDDPDRVNRWRAALSKAGKLSGKHCETSTDESNLIEEIVAVVGTKLERLHNCQGTLKDAVGIDEMVKPIEELLEKFNKVGIWGMGGVGKTTMAKALFAKLSYRYDNCCFMDNMREKIERYGSEHVCNSIVSELLGQDKLNNSSDALRRNAFVARRLGSIKAFVVLDDVNSSKQLQDLQDKICNFLGEGSKVILTTRDKKLLRGNGYEIHEAEGLSYDNSCRLFIRKAFGSEHPEDGYEQLITGFVDYTQRNPLALGVLGSYVHFEDKKLWDDLLRKLRAGSPNDEIQTVLRMSYDGLDYKEKQIFLDIACFLKGEREEFVEELLESYEFYPTVGIQTLKDKALIVTTSRKVQMHDLIQEMGYQIVCEESVKEPGKRSRLWDPREIYDVLKNCEGEKEVEGLMFDISKIRPLELTAKTFNQMTRIRFLKFYSYSHYGNGISIPTGLESISTKIRYFHWEGYPGKSLPSNFCAELLLELNLKGSMVETLWEGVQDLSNLRRLILGECRNLRELPDLSKACSLESVDLSYCKRLNDVHASLLSLHKLRYFHWQGYPGKSFPSNICAELLLELNLEGSMVETLWEGVQDLANLRRLVLGECRNLRELPDFSKACRLESVDLSHCERLSDVHESLLSLHSLIVLDVRYCSDLKSLKSRIHLKSLRELVIFGCENLKEFSVSSEELTSLNLSKTLIEEWSPSIVRCSRLRGLYLVDTKLNNVPIQALSCLTFLDGLSISNLQNIDNFSVRMLFDCLRSLQSVSLIECCNLTELPDNIAQLSGLDRLDLKRCPNLTKLPVSMRDLSKLQYLSVEGCTALRSLPELPPSLRELIAIDCTSLETVNISTIPSTPWDKGRTIFSFINCVNLDVSAIEEQAKCLLRKAAHEKVWVAVSYPGKKVPEWFGNNRTQDDSDTVNLSLSSHTLQGFIFCTVLPDYLEPEKVLSRPSIICYLGWEKRKVISGHLAFQKVRAGHVILCSLPDLAKSILDEIEENKENHEAATYNPNFLFRFRFGYYAPNLTQKKYYAPTILTFPAKEGGAYPIYASQDSELNPNSRKRKAIMI
ncbi:hypothetical protein QN277_022353 [Acacia crassicarpa]|uniref:TIR domain-containing protein n=1 Tax=Acacia crassicarpa TaxID=499986 RepID=A0AAE1JHL0_9FABA|nr:hypothetical protein QN277_022353 [Acacia crassicarpa]